MLHLLKRHLIPVKALLRRSLVVTYAFPRNVLEPLLAPGLSLDTYGDYGFLAIALVQAEQMRPSFMPRFLGRSFFLSGYRVFARLDGSKSIRGLRILRSDTDRSFMFRAGNWFTHYHYQLCQAEVTDEGAVSRWSVTSIGGDADLEIAALTTKQAARLPASTPFANNRDARRFAGPLPFTFEYEEETNSIIQVRGVRIEWNPKLVDVDVRRCTFLERSPFNGQTHKLASAYYLEDIPYRWERGRLMPIGKV